MGDDGEKAALDRLTAVLQDILDNDEITLSMKTTAEGVDGWDSVANIRLMIAVESEFGVRFDVGEFQEFRNVGDLVKGILKRHVKT